MVTRCILALILGVKSFSYSQLLTHANVQLTINAGVQLTVNGDIQNNTGTTLDNNGSIHLTGNWINNSGNAIFGTSLGSVTLNGMNQQIGGSFTTDFYHLNLFNGTKTLLVNTSAGGTGFPSLGRLNCNNAILKLKGHTLSVHNSSALGITKTTGYILSEDADNSSKVWWVTVAQGLHTIPFGNMSGEDISFSFSITVPPQGSSTGSMRVSTYQTAANNTPFPFTPVLVTHVNNTSGTDNSANTVDRFWHVEKTGTADYYFDYGPSENAVNGNVNMRAQSWNPVNQGWQAPTAGQSNPTLQRVYVPNLVPVNPFVMEGATWAIARQATPLPVELLDFTASYQNNTEVECTWQTASEINNDYFIVMRSPDGITFEDIGHITGGGNSTTFLNYTFTDQNPFPGLSYYRLKQVDFNGDFSLSQIVTIKTTDRIPEVHIYPNPATGIFYIFLKSENQALIQYYIRDIAGKTVKQGQYITSENNQPVDIFDLSTGFYFLEINYPGRKYIKKIQVLHEQIKH